MQDSLIPSKTQPASTLPSNDLLAAIDLGSNSFRLEIAELKNDRYKRVFYLKETVRLGAGLDAQSMLTDEAMDRGLVCLEKFQARLAGIPSQQVRAVATQTLREARNRDAFLQKATQVLGHPIEVISGREEARLIYQGVSRLQPSDTPRLVIDIGGRSTEMILGRGRCSNLAESFSVGSVSLSMKHFPTGQFTAEAFHAAQIEAGSELEEALVPFAQKNWCEAMGSSGTVGAIADVLKACGITNGCITPSALRWCIDQCIKAKHIDRLTLPGLKPDRKAVIGGGLSILYTLAIQFNVQVLIPAKGALRQGVVFDLVDRLDSIRNSEKTDPRDASVRELQRRFQVDRSQAKRVRHTALTLWDNWNNKNPPLDTETRKELGWACDLHEIGMVVSHHDHHRHSAYLLGHADAAGFSQSQLRQLAILLLGQRGDLSKLEEYFKQTTLMKQVMCLRLAAIVHHARLDMSSHLTTLDFDNLNNVCHLQFQWADEYPRSCHLLKEESNRWTAQHPYRLVIHNE